MSRRRKKVNETFFDEESKAMWYVLGAFYSCSNYTANNRIMFISSQKSLVEIVLDQLESDYSIVSDPRERHSTHWIQMNGVPYMKSRLEEIGLDVPKTKRKFPKNVHKDYIGHFVRGFLDGKGLIGISSGKYTRVVIQFNHSFLSSLHQVLLQYAGVQKDGPDSNIIRYSHRNSLKIHDFIYRDWAYIQESGLYLPSKKKLFRTDYPADGFIHPNAIAVQQRISEAKELLDKGIPIRKLFLRVGYSYPSGLSRAFNRQVYKTMTQYLRKSG